MCGTILRIISMLLFRVVHWEQWSKCTSFGVNAQGCPQHVQLHLESHAMINSKNIIGLSIVFGHLDYFTENFFLCCCIWNILQLLSIQKTAKRLTMLILKTHFFLIIWILCNSVGFSLCLSCPIMWDFLHNCAGEKQLKPAQQWRH